MQLVVAFSDSKVCERLQNLDSDEPQWLSKDL